MSTTLHRRSPPRGRSPYLSDSPRRSRVSPTRRSHRRERSPDNYRSTTRTRSPVRTRAKHSTRSPGRGKLHSHHERSPNYEVSKFSHIMRSPKEKVRDHARSPIYDRFRSPRKEKLMKQKSKSPAWQQPSSPRRGHMSHSPSPRTKRLRRAHEEKEADKLMDKDYRRVPLRVEENGRKKEHVSDKDVSIKKRSSHEQVDRSSKADRHDHSISPVEGNHKSRYSSGSPSRSSKIRAREEVMRTSEAKHHGNDEDDSVARMKAVEESLEAKQKEKPSFELSGKLAEETNRVRGVTLLFTEPEEARKPDIRWRLYVFKAGEVLNEPLYVHRQSCYLFGRERRVADVPTDHPSCSKQHAVIQFRLVEKEQPDGMMKKQVRPYLMDLGSTNGTFLNDNRIEAQRYYELFEKDTIKFGNSSREYVLLHENSTG